MIGLISFCTRHTNKTDCKRDLNGDLDQDEWVVCFYAELFTLHLNTD